MPHSSKPQTDFFLLHIIATMFSDKSIAKAIIQKIHGEQKWMGSFNSTGFELWEKSWRTSILIIALNLYFHLSEKAKTRWKHGHANKESSHKVSQEETNIIHWILLRIIRNLWGVIRSSGVRKRGGPWLSGMGNGIIRWEQQHKMGHMRWEQVSSWHYVFISGETLL